MAFDPIDDAAAGRGCVPLGVTITCDVLDWDDLARTIEEATSMGGPRYDRRAALATR
jgi:hypothetical protein